MSAIQDRIISLLSQGQNVNAIQAETGQPANVIRSTAQTYTNGSYAPASLTQRVFDFLSVGFSDNDVQDLLGVSEQAIAAAAASTSMTVTSGFGPSGGGSLAIGSTVTGATASSLAAYDSSGKLANGPSTNSVTSEVLPLWQPTTAYTVGQQVAQANQHYQCLVAHTSGATWPGVGTNWALIGSAASGKPNAITNASGAITLANGYNQYFVSLSAAGVITVRPPTGVGDSLALTVSQPAAGGAGYALAPPGSPSISAVGSPVTTATAGSPTSYTTNVSPVNVGDILVVMISNGVTGSGTPVESVSGGGVAQWNRVISGIGGEGDPSAVGVPGGEFDDNKYASIWWGVVTTTGASVITTTWPGVGASSGQIVVQEFTAGAGYTAWAFDKAATIGTSGTAITLPALAPSTNLGELYVAQVFGTGGTYTAGSSSGAVYGPNETVYGTDVTATFAPTATQTGSASTQYAALAALFFVGSLALKYTSGLTPAPSLSPGAIDQYSFISPDGVNWTVTPENVASSLQSIAGANLPAPITVVDPTTYFADQVDVPWMNLGNSQDPALQMGVRYRGVAGVDHLLLTFGDVDNGQGMVIEWAPQEPALIFGAGGLSSGNFSFPVSTYLDSSSVFHFGNSVATDNPSGSHNAPTSGSLVWRMPFVGTGFKLLLLQFINYVNNTTTNDVFNTQTGGYNENEQVPFSTTYAPLPVANNSGLTIAVAGQSSPAGNQITVTTPDSATAYNGWALYVGI